MKDLIRKPQDFKDLHAKARKAIAAYEDLDQATKRRHSQFSPRLTLRTS